MIKQAAALVREYLKLAGTLLRSGMPTQTARETMAQRLMQSSRETGAKPLQNWTSPNLMPSVLGVPAQQRMPGLAEAITTTTGTPRGNAVAGIARGQRTIQGAANSGVSSPLNYSSIMQNMAAHA